LAEQLKNSLDNPTSTLAAGIASGDLALTVAAGHGARLPATGTFRLKLTDQADDTLYELVICTARATDVCTITRAAEGTTARAFVTGDLVDLVLTEDGLEAWANERYWPLGTDLATQAEADAIAAGAVILAPAASARNVIQPTAGDALTLNYETGDTALYVGSECHGVVLALKSDTAHQFLIQALAPGIGNILEVTSNAVFADSSIRWFNVQTGFFGAQPVAKPAAPTTLNELVTSIQSLGLTA
jgi:hypothetical protein